ncbi:MAG: hypothetical protein ACREOW_17865 [Thermodesulfobacteriota bacterium]
MMRKATLALVITISALMFYTGCDGDGEGEAAPPGSGDPCLSCPCRYFDVPMTEACWLLRPPPPSDHTNGRPHFRIIETLPSPTPQLYECLLGRDPTEGLRDPTYISYFTPNDLTDDGFRPECEIHPMRGCTPCQRCNTVIRSLNGLAEVDACRSCLELYARELNQVIPVDAPDGFTCPETP